MWIICQVHPKLRYLSADPHKNVRIDPLIDRKLFIYDRMPDVSFLYGLLPDGLFGEEGADRQESEFTNDLLSSEKTIDHTLHIVLFHCGQILWHLDTMCASCTTHKAHLLHKASKFVPNH
jgi:hypothetical protein